MCLDWFSTLGCFVVNISFSYILCRADNLGILKPRAVVYDLNSTVVTRRELLISV